jgi:predicted dehydrogenase
MIKIAFLGSDSTHTEAFGKRINLPDSPFYGRAKVVSLWGENPEQTVQKAAELKIERVCASPEEALLGVDLAMVIGRFGQSHFQPTRIALESKIPTFVDKPFTVDLKEARQLTELSKKVGVPLCSSSPLRFAKETLAAKALLRSEPKVLTVAASMPANCTDLGDDPRLQSPFFYGIHGTEILLEVLGHDIQSTDIRRSKGVTAVTLEYSDGRTGVLNYVRDAGEFYALDLYTTQGSWHRTLDLDGAYYAGMLSFLLDEFYGGKSTIPLENTLRAIALLEQVEGKK